jgi:predicted PurR-regulated permease PerM
VVLIPVVRQMMQWKVGSYHISRPIAVVILLIGIFGGITLFFWLGLPPVLHDLRSFAQDLPARIPGLMDKLKHLPLADKLGVESMSHRAETALAATASYIFTSLPEWGTHILDIGTAVILTVYFILEGELLYNYLLSFLPLTPRIRLGATLERAETRVSRWLIGQLLLMSIQGIYSIIVFGSLGVRYFVLLGILMGVTNIIPIAGNLVTIVIVFSVAAVDSWTKAILVLVFYGIYSQVETAYLTPRIMRTSVDLMAISVLIALMCGTALAGIVGALVAVPSAALVGVLADEYLVHKDEWA